MFPAMWMNPALSMAIAMELWLSQPSVDASRVNVQVELSSVRCAMVIALWAS